jgi:hypothetical protein
MGLWRDFFAHSGKPHRQPLPNRHSAGINVLAGIERSQEPSKLFLSSAAIAFYCCCYCPPLSGGRIATKAVAQLP